MNLRSGNFTILQFLKRHFSLIFANYQIFSNRPMFAMPPVASERREIYFKGKNSQCKTCTFFRAEMTSF